MYLEFYQLSKKPFHVTPDPEFLYLSPSHREALASIVYGVEQRKGIIEITGEVGTGKTTVLRSYLGQVDLSRMKTAYVLNPNVSFPVLMKAIFEELGIVPKSEEANVMVGQFHQFLIEEFKKNHTVVVVIDEAQNMPVETLENLRLLSNLETAKDKLLQIVLCGQPELEEHLGRRELRQLKQRIAVHADISLLSHKESLEYIRFRLSKASKRKNDVFSAAALARIVAKANGNPRVINILCDNALITGFGKQEKRISAGTASEIIGDLQEKPFLMNHWKVGIAGISILFLLTTGYWVYGRKIAVPIVRVESPNRTFRSPGNKLEHAPRADRKWRGGKLLIPASQLRSLSGPSHRMFPPPWNTEGNALRQDRRKR